MRVALRGGVMRWATLVLALSVLLVSTRSEARDLYYVTHEDWLQSEGYCYNHDEFVDTTPTMDARPAGQPSNRPVPDLDCWLSQAHPEIADLIFFMPTSGDAVGYGSYANWTSAQKRALASQFAQAWNWFEEGYVPRGAARKMAPNLAPESGMTIFSATSAWSLYTEYVGVVLAAQLGHWFTWDIRGEMWMSTEDLRGFLDSNFFFPYFDAWPTGTGTIAGYGIGQAQGAVTPTSAIAQIDFLRKIGAIRASAADTVYAALDWGRDNLAHFSGGFEPENEFAVWQYRGYPPVSRIIAGTTSTSPQDAGMPKLHWTAGCHGTSGFYKSVLRAAMIPVKITTMCGHSQLHFPMIGVETFLTHSDAIYSRGFRDSNLGTPYDLQYPPTSPLRSTLGLAIYESDYDLFFSSPHVSREQACTNVNLSETGFMAGTAGNQTNALMSAYCHDLAQGLSHADGAVYREFFVDPLTGLETTSHSLANLESSGLWGRLEKKRRRYGCKRFP